VQAPDSGGAAAADAPSKPNGTRVRRVSSSAPVLGDVLEHENEDEAAEGSDTAADHETSSASPAGASFSAQAAPAQEGASSSSAALAAPSPPASLAQDKQADAPAGSGPPAATKRVGFAALGPDEAVAGPSSTAQSSWAGKAVAVSPFQSIAGQPFCPGDTDAGHSAGDRLPPIMNF
jgi:hypothetical protein